MNDEFDAAALAREAVAQTFSPPEPQPLLPPLPATPAFPVYALGEKLRPVAEAVQVRTQAPTVVAAHSVLGAASLAVQAHADVELPTGERNPTSLDMLTIAGSGERKTACDSLAQRGVAARERELRDAYECDMLAYRNNIDAWEQARSEAKGSKVKGVEAKREALNKLGPPRQPPLTPLLTIDEPTLEGMTRLFRVGTPASP